MNKPVAWMALNELNGSYSTFTNDQKQRLLPHISQCYGKWIPLYTHPPAQQWTIEAKFKELTDEEIMELSYLTSDNDPIDFAKAILRKASEK